MANVVKLAVDFKDWFNAYQGVDYISWFDSQDRRDIKDMIMDFLENNVEGTYSQNKKLAIRIFEELNSDR